MLYDLKDIVQSNDAKIKLRKLIEEGRWIELTKKKEKRTVKMNSYLHVVITMFAIKFGYTLDEAKTLLKRECNFMVYEKNGIKFLRRTRDLNTIEASDFISWIRNYSSQNGFYILSAEEYKENSYAIDEEINKHKQYL